MRTNRSRTSTILVLLAAGALYFLQGTPAGEMLRGLLQVTGNGDAVQTISIGPSGSTGSSTGGLLDSIGSVVGNSGRDGAPSTGSGSGHGVGRAPTAPAEASTPEASFLGKADSRIEELFSGRKSGVVLEGAGVIVKLLRDDTKGSRHQLMILRLNSGRSLLLSHNIDLAPRVDAAREGDVLAFRGQYEWNDRGGVVHWTHHDPGGRRPGGWLQHEGRRYR